MKSHDLKKALCQWTAMLALVVAARFGRLMASILASRRKYPGRRKGPFGCQRAGTDAAELCESAANDPA